MGLTLFVGGQEGVTWDQWRVIAQGCEDHGVDGLFTSDHYMPIVSDDDAGSLDSWTVLAGLAVATTRLRLGTLVSPVGFRHPSQLARVVSTVDHLSGGRAELGLGAGWNEHECRAYGFPFPKFTERLEVFAEQLEIIYREWTEDTVDHEGLHYTLEQARARPKPVQRPTPPLIVGGVGGPLTTGPAVRFATEYNTWMPTVEQVSERRALVTAACRAGGRDPTTLRFTTLTPMVIGASQAEVHERIRELLDSMIPDWDSVHDTQGESGAGVTEAAAPRPRQEPKEFIEANGDVWAIGTVDEIRARIAELRAAGSEHVYLDHRHHRDVDGLKLVGELI
jgi:F420-dependent oxidoreductase-like protein